MKDTIAKDVKAQKEAKTVNKNFMKEFTLPAILKARIFSWMNRYGHEYKTGKNPYFVYKTLAYSDSGEEYYRRINAFVNVFEQNGKRKIMLENHRANFRINLIEELRTEERMQQFFIDMEERALQLNQEVYAKRWRKINEVTFEDGNIEH